MSTVCNNQKTFGEKNSVCKIFFKNNHVWSSFTPTQFLEISEIQSV